MRKNTRPVIALLIALGVALVACRSGARTGAATPVAGETAEAGAQVEVTRIVEQIVEVTNPPTNAPAGPKELVICQTQEPESLYLYGDTTPGARNVQHAIYEDYVTNLTYTFQAGALEKLPSLGDGDAVLRSVAVAAGDVVVKANDTVGPLAVSDVIIDSSGEAVTFDGGPVMMDQLVVDFEMRPTVWSDGAPVRAADSVYSFTLLSAPDTPAPKYTAERTAGYEATGKLSTRWTGLPGFRDPNYFTNFFAPLPEHLWSEYSAAELLSAEESSRLPIGDGPFVVEEWRAGDSIRLVRNDNYWRAGAGLPYLDRVTFRFIPDANQLLAYALAGQCDIVPRPGFEIADTPLIVEAETAGLLVAQFQSGATFQHIDFAVDPYGDYGDTRYDWFEDVRVRQAMTLCTDRRRMIDELLFGRAAILHTYIPTAHPLYPAEEATEWPFDPEAGNELLDEAGYDQRDGEGFRLDPDGGGFAPSLGTTAGNGLRAGIARIFKENMAVCGIDVQLYDLPESEWFADGPGGPLFGRHYDLGLFAWLTGVRPPCELYMGDQVPGPADEINEKTGLPFGRGWDGQNSTGWVNAEYDAACARASRSLPGAPEYAEAHVLAQQIFAREAPIIPLFLSLKLGVARPEVLNYHIDPTQESHLYNIEEIDIQ